MREVIVVCYGNICRSPIGNVLLQRAIDARLGPEAVLVTGAGIGADDGRPPSQGSIHAMTSRGVDLRSYRSRYLSLPRAKAAWRIYCMEDYQVAHVRQLLPPEAAERVQLWGGEQVDDPLGSTQQAYENVALQLERLLPVVVEDIVAAIEAEDAGSTS
jgi:protein-tyrosine phosphatase